jgi:hypothetical protein
MLSQVDSLDAADKLRGWDLLISMAEREPLMDPDEFWAQDLAGCAVFLVLTWHFCDVQACRCKELASSQVQADTKLPNAGMNRMNCSHYRVLCRRQLTKAISAMSLI